MKKRLLACLLTAAMLTSLFPLPALAAEAERPEWMVTAFDPLDGDTAAQTVPQGGEPVLPDSLTASAYVVGDDTTVIVVPPEDDQPQADGAEEPADRQEPDIQPVTIPGVTWEAQPGTDLATPGEYVYTPALPAAYAVAEGVELPVISVTVTAAEQTALQRVRAMIDALPAPEDITPDNRADVEAQLEAIGEAWAELSEEDALLLDTARCLAAQEALAALEGQENDLPTTLAGETGDLIVAGGALNTDYTYENNTLTITTSGTYTITGNGTATTDKIVITNGVTAYVTLQNVSIDVSGTSGACAFEVAGSATCNLTLTEGNTLKSGYERAGLQVQNGAELVITQGSAGTLNATGGYQGAGIGGGRSRAGGTITINGGTVTATGGVYAAGIGVGGFGGAGGTITINGGTVTATGGSYAAGIGGGYDGSGGTITINGGEVTATGDSAADIGNGRRSDAGSWPSGSTTFSTGENGHAIIYASGISDLRDIDSWKGIIFRWSGGQVYGDQTLQTDFEIPRGKTLTVPNGVKLTVADGKTLTNNGTIINEGEIEGTLENNGIITNNGTISGSLTSNGTITNDGGTISSNVTNNSGGVISNSGTMTGPVNNSGMISNNTSAAISGGVTNNSTGVISNRGTISGALENNGTTVNCGTISGNQSGSNSVIDAANLTISYRDETGQQKTIPGGETVTYLVPGMAGTEATQWDRGGWYVVYGGNVELNEAVTVSSNVNLVLMDGCTLKTTKGITVGENSSLTIYGQSVNSGVLDTSGGNLSVPGIKVSGSTDGTGARLTINSGKVIATGGSGGAYGDAGIEVEGVRNGSNGEILINGGEVSATGTGGAGIGSDCFSYNGCGNITITGGTVKAVCNNDKDGGGAGIGGGYVSDGNFSIKITGGTVTAEGGKSAAGIGTGRLPNGNPTISIDISGGTVTAIGGGNDSAGIGTGWASNSTPSGTITISGGTVTATGGPTYADGIGCGYDTTGNLTFSTGTDGSALIDATSITSNTDSNQWSGVIFNGETGQVYGSPTLGTDATIPSGKRLEIPEGKTLTIDNNVTLTNNGLISVYGTISGSLTNNGTIMVGPEGRVPSNSGGSVIQFPDGTYLDASGTPQNIPTTGTKFLQPGMTTLSSGWYVVCIDVTLPERLTVTGDVNLILVDGCKLDAQKGITVEGSNSLTIYAQSNGSNMGALTATGNYGAGIGGYYGAGGTITINGGNVTATSKGDGAGIGGGFAGDGGEITINGGTVTATGDSGAGIGGGFAGDGGEITINGGTVTATGDNGAGIGGGDSGAGGTITISGGTVTATGVGDYGYAGAGIGGGDGGAGGTITISGGTVTATGGSSGGVTATGIGNGGQNEEASTFTTGDDGNAFIIASSISDNDNTTGWRGVIFEGNDGKVYGNQTLKADMEISGDKKLTIPENTILAIDDDVTLTNDGEITNNGTLQINETGKLVNNGTITNNSTNRGITGTGAIEGSGTLTGSGTLADDVKYPRQSSVTISFEGSDVTGGNSVPYGSTITIKATAAKAAANGLNRAAANPMEFFVGTGSSKRSLGTAGVDGNGTASLQITLSGTDWGKGFQIDANTITAEYGGSEYLKDATQTVTLTVTKKELTATISGTTTTKIYDGNTTATGLSIDLTGKVSGDDVSATATSYTYDDANVGDNKIITASGITLTGAKAGNYTLKSDTATTTGSIGKATPTPDTPNNLTAIYGQTLADVSLPTGWAWDNSYTSVGDIGSKFFPATYTQDNSGNYNTVPQNLTVTVSAAPRTITVTGTASSPTQITLNEAVINPSGTSGKVSYGKNTINTAPSTWQEGKEFSGLTADTTYYFFAKVGASGNYAEAVSAGVAISTPAKAVSSIAIATQPTTLTYTSGQALDLSGLSVTVNYDDGSASDTIAWSSNKLTADPAAGTALTVTGHHGKTVTISYGGQTATTSTLTVTQGTQDTASITGAPATIYNGDSFTLTLSGGSGTGAVTWEIVSGPATVDATTGKVTVTGTGEIQIKAVKAADTDYTQTEATITLNAVARPSPPTGGGGGGTYTPTYPPTVEKPSGGGGTPAVTPSNPRQGDTVTVTPKPDSGYEVDTITVIDRNGKPVEVTKKPDGTYTFKQPSGKVTVKVTYQPIDWPWNNPFTDVSEGDWYYEAVRFVQERGLMNGYEDGRFGPNDNLSRAQLAQILFNKEGRPGVDYLLDFSDVAGEAWYTEAIRWAASQGIVGGYGNGTFGPNDPITREQLAVMLWRYSGSPAATNKELHFADADEISPFALEALRWAVENGILNGYGDGRLGPQGQATRAQVAQMLKNFIENQEENT